MTPTACPLCGQNDYVFIYTPEPDLPAIAGIPSAVVYTCICGCVFSRKAENDARDQGEAAQ